METWRLCQLQQGQELQESWLPEHLAKPLMGVELKDGEGIWCVLGIGREGVGGAYKQYCKALGV